MREFCSEKGIDAKARIQKLWNYINKLNIPFKLSGQTVYGCALRPLELGVRSA
jgi:hypothetical protein